MVCRPFITIFFFVFLCPSVLLALLAFLIFISSGAWERILQLVVVGLNDSESIVRYHAAKFLEDFTKSLLDLETNGVATNLDVSIIPLPHFLSRLSFMIHMLM